MEIFSPSRGVELERFRQIHEKPIEWVNIPQDSIPPLLPYNQRPRPASYYGDYVEHLNEVVIYIASRVSDSTLKKALVEPGKDGGYAFRGIRRKKDPFEPLHPSHPDSTLIDALQNINELGIEKRKTQQIWFTPAFPADALFYAIPENTADELGIFIISEWDGMEYDNRYGGDYSSDYGMNLKEGYTYLQLHLGTIILDIAGA